jgi:hypothetical protein
MMSAADALAFIEAQGVVLVAGRGPVPRLVEVILGEPIKGSWWAHPASHRIFAVLQAVEESGDLLVCRLVEGKVTLVHRRLWSALVRLQRRFTRQQLAQIHEQHTPSGKHVNRLVKFPAWAPASVLAAARRMSDEEAERILAPVLACAGPRHGTARSFRSPRPVGTRRPARSQISRRPR